MRRFLGLFMLFLSLIPLSASAVEQNWPAVTVDDHPGVVVPRDEADGLWMFMSLDDIDGYWLPGVPWLEKAEAAVTVAASAIADPARQPILGGYRQYAGVVANGERKIFINSFCKEFGGWRSQYILVMDGGPCFWSALYDVTTGEIERLYVNGSA